MSKHTPGPWDIINQYIIAADESVICQWESYTEEADARLLAAAPDLLAAVTGLVEAYHDSIHGVASFSQATKLATAMDAARVAIAKAEGVSPSPRPRSQNILKSS